jgi:ribonuclease HI
MVSLGPLGLSLFCDGSARNNGRAGAKAGFGVHICNGNTTVHQYAALIPGHETQTNQRAELRALDYSIKYIADGRHAGATIYTDSKYSIDVLLKWCEGWERKGWRKADGKPVLHQDIIQPMWVLWKSIRAVTSMVHVPAHTGAADFASRGNAEADRLATSMTE